MTGRQAEPSHYHYDLNYDHYPVPSEDASLLLNYDAYGIDERSHPHILMQLQAQPHVSTLQVVIHHGNSQQPQHLYHYLRGLGIPFLQFIPLVAVDDAGNLTADSVQAEEWGAFLIAVFDLWVQKDIEQIHIRQFDAALGIWRGKSLQVVCDNAPLTDECRECSVLCFCQGDCLENRIADGGKSALCAGYHQFFTYSAPYMKAMRDLLKQHRSPMELMAMLAQSR